MHHAFDFGDQREAEWTDRDAGNQVTEHRTEFQAARDHDRYNCGGKEYSGFGEQAHI